MNTIQVSGKQEKVRAEFGEANDVDVILKFSEDELYSLFDYKREEDDEDEGGPFTGIKMKKGVLKVDFSIGAELVIQNETTGRWEKHREIGVIVYAKFQISGTEEHGLDSTGAVLELKDVKVKKVKIKKGPQYQVLEQELVLNRAYVYLSKLLERATPRRIYLRNVVNPDLLPKPLRFDFRDVRLSFDDNMKVEINYEREGDINEVKYDIKENLVKGLEGLNVDEATFGKRAFWKNVFLKNMAIPSEGAH